jgi:phage shock protein A
MEESMGITSRVRLLYRIRANAALDRAEDPREVMDYAAGQQRELLRNVRRGLIDVATARRQIEQQGEQLRERVGRMDDQARRALDSGREDLARLALQRKQTALAQIDQLGRQLAELTGDEQRMIVAEQQLSLQVEEFTGRRKMVAAQYSAAEAQVRLTEMIAGVSGELADLSMAVGRAEEKTDQMRARAVAIDSLLDSGSLAAPFSTYDPVERELRRLTMEQAVDDELTALRNARGTASVDEDVQEESR